jgi:hypothetical protein
VGLGAQWRHVSSFLLTFYVHITRAARSARDPSEAAMRQQVRALIGFIACATLGGVLTNACSAAGDGDPGGSGGSGAGSGAGAGTGVGGSTTISSGAGIDASGTTGTGGSGGSCASLSSEAESEIQPADIIIAVDTSGSMDEESAEVQANLNNFAAIILASGVDAHVVLIADESVCIPAMLGSGSCPGDENLPAYRHVVQTVNSNDALQVILSTYPQWKDTLRPNASKTIAVVSDDESDLSANDFTNQLLALDPPTFQGFKFDAIVSFDDPQACLTACFLSGCVGCGACCPSCMPLAAAEGGVYKQLVQQTTGVIGDLCQQDFDPVFADMATSVVQGSGISCDYPIPAVPGGDPIDPTKVNVNYTPGGTMDSQPIGYVPGGQAACGAQNGGWYYDDPQNPTTIIMCPSTCAALQGDAMGKVEVLFGCDTVIAVPD